MPVFRAARRSAQFMYQQAPTKHTNAQEVIRSYNPRDISFSDASGLSSGAHCKLLVRKVRFCNVRLYHCISRLKFKLKTELLFVRNVL